MEGLEGLSAQELIAKRDGIEQELREQLSILDQVGIQLNVSCTGTHFCTCAGRRCGHEGCSG